MKLTSVDPELDQIREKTPSGMAFWAGTGPQGRTCRECAHYGFIGYKSNRGFKGGTLKNGSCLRYAEMTRQSGGKFPFDTPSCKYFEENEKIPPIVNPRK